MKSVKCWHFIREDRRLGYGDNRLVRPGREYKCDGEIMVCGNGMHGSRRIIDATKYAPGPIVCRVVISGEISEDDNKLAGRCRMVEWMADATMTLHEFACRCAEGALALVDADSRSVAAIKAKRLWMAGKITDDVLDAARAAAWEAARAAAWEAAGGAAGGAAWGAAWGAARGAAWGAAWEAARGAAWEAAGAAAWGAAWEAAWGKQNRRLTSMVSALKREEG